MALPDTYKQVEYIESSGTQYISTGLTLSPNITFEFQFQLLSTDNNQGIIGARASSGNTNRHSLITYNNTFHFMTGDNAGWNGSVNLNKHTVKLTGSNNNWNINVDGTNYSSTGTVNTNSSVPYYIFRNGVQNSSYVKIYYVKFYNSGTLVRDFIPVVRISDSKPGLYDLVNNVFYTNQGTGEFSYPAQSGKITHIYVGANLVRPKPKQIVETITLASGQSVWYNNIYKQGYKIVSIREQGTLSNQNTWENASRCFYNTTSNPTYGIDEYYQLGANVSSYPSNCVELHIKTNGTDSRTDYTQVFSGYGTLTYDITVTEESRTAIYNGTTKTHTYNSTEKEGIKTLFGGNVYPRHRVYSQASFGQATLTVTYEEV